MELHQLRYFVAVADLRSFTRAAERCLVSQPSLSQQIIKLERELGKPVFERLGRTVQLTKAGHALYEQAAAILRSVEEIQERVAAADAPDQGSITVGAIPTIAPYLLPPVLKSFARRLPDANVALRENLTEWVVRGCLEGELDVGIIASAPTVGLLSSEVLFTEELLLALPPRHALLKRRSIALADVVEEPFILMSELHCLGEQIMGFCQQQECLPIVHCESVQLLTIQELVSQGHGVSLIPAMASEMDRGRRCEYRSLGPPTPTRTIRMIWHQDRYQSPVVKEFLSELRAATTPTGTKKP